MSFWDDLWGDTPPEEIARVRREVDAQWQRARTYECAYGCCTNYLDPDTDEVFAGFGPVGCPCDDTDDRAVLLARRVS